MIYRRRDDQTLIPQARTEEEMVNTGEFRQVGETVVVAEPGAEIPVSLLEQYRRWFAEGIAADLTRQFGVPVSPEEVQQMRLVNGGIHPETNTQAQFPDGDEQEPLDPEKAKNRSRGLKAVETRIRNWMLRHPGHTVEQAREAMMSKARAERKRKAAARKRAA